MVVPAIRYLSTGEAIREVRTIMRAQGRPAALAARDVVDRVRPDSLRELAAVGLAQLAGAAKSLSNREAIAEAPTASGRPAEPPAASGRLAPRPIHYAKEYGPLALVEYQGADGRNKVLLDFTREDAFALLQRAGGQIHGWVRVKKVAERMNDLLVETGKATVRGLSDEQLAEIARLL